MCPYAYCNNNPINNVDPDGRDWYSYQEEYEEDGEKKNRTQYKYVEGQMSKEEIKNGRYTHMGKFFADGNTYYSLFGSKYSSDSKEGKTMQKIDEALINSSNVKEEFDYYGNRTSTAEEETNFDIGEYPRTTQLGVNEDTYFSFEAEGGQVTYFKVGKGVENKAKFGGWGYVNKGTVKGQGNRGVGNLKDGIPIDFERQRTKGNKVQKSAQIVFPTTQAAKVFYNKYIQLFKK